MTIEPNYDTFFNALCDRVRQLSDKPVTCLCGTESQAFGSTDVPYVQIAQGDSRVVVYVPVMGELRFGIFTSEIVGYSEEYEVSSRINHEGRARRTAQEVGLRIFELLSHTSTWRKVDEGFVFSLPSGDFFFQD